MVSVDWYVRGVGERHEPVRPYVPIEVVQSQTEGKNSQLERAYSGDNENEAIVILGPREIPKAVIEPPENIYPLTIVPLEISAPTAKLVSNDAGTGAGHPWSTAPAAMAFAPAAIGSLLVMMGRQVIAEMAIAGATDLLSRTKKRYDRPGVQFRFLTGAGEAAYGAIVRPRGAGGSIPEGTNPYEDPKDCRWWEPWCYIF